MISRKIIEHSEFGARNEGLGIRATDIKPIKTETDYELALQEIERLMDAEPNTPDGDRLDVLATLVDAWEEKHHSIEDPDPIEAIWRRSAWRAKTSNR